VKSRQPERVGIFPVNFRQLRDTFKITGLLVPVFPFVTLKTDPTDDGVPAKGISSHHIGGAGGFFGIIIFNVAVDEGILLRKFKQLRIAAQKLLPDFRLHIEVFRFEENDLIRRLQHARVRKGLVGLVKIYGEIAVLLTEPILGSGLQRENRVIHHEGFFPVDPGTGHFLRFGSGYLLQLALGYLAQVGGIDAVELVDADKALRIDHFVFKNEGRLRHHLHTHFGVVDYLILIP